MTTSEALWPALILAADHRARGVMTVESWDGYVGALTAALPHCDGILASAEPLRTLAAAGALAAGQRTYLSVNRTGLAGSVFEVDDRLVASVGRAAAEGWTGVKHMTRVDRSDPATSGALELLGRVLEEAAAAGLEALVECVPWAEGRMGRATDDVVAAAVIAHDMGAPVLKVPLPDVPAGGPRREAVARVVGSVGAPVLFLGGPRRYEGRSVDALRAFQAGVLEEVGDAMAGGAAGMALGRVIIEDPEPARMAAAVAAAVHGERSD